MNIDTDAGDSQQLNTASPPGAGQAAPTVPADMAPAEPNEGGSYIRNLATGTLDKAPPPAAQPDQE